MAIRTASTSMSISMLLGTEEGGATEGPEPSNFAPAPRSSSALPTSPPAPQFAGAVSDGDTGSINRAGFAVTTSGREGARRMATMGGVLSGAGATASATEVTSSKGTSTRGPERLATSGVRGETGSAAKSTAWPRSESPMRRGSTQ